MSKQKLEQRMALIAGEIDELLDRGETPWAETLEHWRDLLRYGDSMEKTKEYVEPAPIRHSDTSTFTLSKKMKKRWVAALRSGKYKKGRNRLYNNRRDSYCCLGVLCHLLGADPATLDGKSMPEDIGLFRNVEFNVGGKGLAYLNDNGTPFNRIADLIEKHVPTHD